MPKATLSFTLPEESEEFRHANNAFSYVMVIENTLSFIRNELKYNKVTEEQYHVYEKLRQKIVELLDEQDVSL